MFVGKSWELALAAEERTSSKLPLDSEAPTFVCKVKQKSVLSCQVFKIETAIIQKGQGVALIEQLNSSPYPYKSDHKASSNKE